MERAKLEEYKDAPGVALLNAFNKGYLTRTEYQTIQKFKKEPWESVDAFLKNIGEEGTKMVDSTKTVPSTKTASEEGTKTVPPITQARKVLKTVSNEEAETEQTGLFKVNIKANFTKVDNDIHTRLKPTQTSVEYSIYDTLYNSISRVITIRTIFCI